MFLDAKTEDHLIFQGYLGEQEMRQIEELLDNYTSDENTRLVVIELVEWLNAKLPASTEPETETTTPTSPITTLPSPDDDLRDAIGTVDDILERLYRTTDDPVIREKLFGPVARTINARSAFNNMTVVKYVLYDTCRRLDQREGTETWLNSFRTHGYRWLCAILNIPSDDSPLSQFFGLS